MTETPSPSAVLSGRDSSLGFRSWSRDLASLVAASVAPPDYPAGDLPRGDGRAVLLIPGFLAGDWTMHRLREFLRQLGYRVEGSGIFFNPGPTRVVATRIERALLRLSDETGPVHIVGQSLGGVFAREMARRHSGRVRSIVTLCTPIRFPVTSPLAPFAHALAPWHDKDWTARMHDCASPLPVPTTAVYSREDGIVDWRQCLQEETALCRNICVSGPHTTMGSNPAAQRIIARALAADVLFPQASEARPVT